MIGRETVAACAFSPCIRKFALGCVSGNIRVLDVKTSSGMTLHEYHTPSEITCMSFLGAYPSFVACDNNAGLSFFAVSPAGALNVPLRDAVRNCRSLCRIDHGGITTAVCFDPQNAMLYVADLRGVVACYDTTQFLVEMDLVPCSANGPIGNDAASCNSTLRDRDPWAVTLKATPDRRSASPAMRKLSRKHSFLMELCASSQDAEEEEGNPWVERVASINNPVAAVTVAVFSNSFVVMCDLGGNASLRESHERRQAPSPRTGYPAGLGEIAVHSSVERCHELSCPPVCRRFAAQAAPTQRDVPGSTREHGECKHRNGLHSVGVHDFSSRAATKPPCSPSIRKVQGAAATAAGGRARCRNDAKRKSPQNKRTSAGSQQTRNR